MGGLVIKAHTSLNAGIVRGSVLHGFVVHHRACYGVRFSSTIPLLMDSYKKHWSFITDTPLNERIFTVARKQTIPEHNQSRLNIFHWP